MNKTTIIAIFVLLLSCAIVSCDNAAEDIISGKQTETRAQEVSELEKVICNTLDTPKYDKGALILYESRENLYSTYTIEEFRLIGVFAQLISGDDSSDLLMAPPGSGWRNDGKGRNLYDAIKIAKKLIDIIPFNQDFLLYIERPGDGTFIVWYKYI